MLPSQEQAISAAGSEICRFLMDSDLDVAGILWSGSFVRQTKSRDSDLDIVFWTGKPKNPGQMKQDIFYSAGSRFLNARVKMGDLAVHVDFPAPLLFQTLSSNAPLPVNVDIVYTAPEHVAKELRMNRKIYSLSQMRKEAAILACYAFHTVLGKEIKSYEVSLAAMNSQETSLVALVIEIVTFFRGRIEQLDLTINQVLAELHRKRFGKMNPAPEPKERGTFGWPDSLFLDPRFDL